MCVCVCVCVCVYDWWVRRFLLTQEKDDFKNCLLLGYVLKNFEKRIISLSNCEKICGIAKTFSGSGKQMRLNCLN